MQAISKYHSSSLIRLGYPDGPRTDVNAGAPSVLCTYGIRSEGVRVVKITDRLRKLRRSPRGLCVDNHTALNTPDAGQDIAVFDVPVIESLLLVHVDGAFALAYLADSAGA
jgi:hypothetical protein